MISSAHNPRVKLARALAGRAKDRREAAAFIAEGVRLIEEALASSWPFQFVLYTAEISERGRQLLDRIRQKGIAVDEVDRTLLSSLSETENSQGILAVLNEASLPMPDAPDFILILDSIRDPGNLGTLLRTADAAHVQAVLLPPETVDAFAPKVLRAGMGAHFRLPIRATTWAEIGVLVAGGKLTVYLADMHGRPCWETEFHHPLALIIGGEAEGATQPARELATERIAIPMAGSTESLNAAVAGSILMFEILRQARTRGA